MERNNEHRKRPLAWGMQSLRYTQFTYTHYLLSLITLTLILSVITCSATIHFALKEVHYIVKFFSIFSPHNLYATYVTIGFLCATIIAIIFLWYTIFFEKKNLWINGFMFLVFLFLGNVFFVAITYLSENKNEKYEKIMLSNIIDYPSDDVKTLNIDTIQNELACCGYNGYEDWKDNKHYVCASNVSSLKCGIPPSCCRRNSKLKMDGKEDEFCGYNAAFKNYLLTTNAILTVEDVIKTDGCKLKILPALRESKRRIGFFSLVMIAIQIIFFSIAQVSSYYLEKTKKLEDEDDLRRIISGSDTNTTGFENVLNERISCDFSNNLDLSCIPSTSADCTPLSSILPNENFPTSQDSEDDSDNEKNSLNAQLTVTAEVYAENFDVVTLQDSVRVESETLVKGVEFEMKDLSTDHHRDYFDTDKIHDQEEDSSLGDKKDISEDKKGEAVGYEKEFYEYMEKTVKGMKDVDQNDITKGKKTEDGTDIATN